MAIAQAQSQSMTSHLSALHVASVAAKACSGALKPKPSRAVPKPTAPARVEITPVFVGIAG
ncbi:MAG: hypothetical protein NZ738_10820 [Oceanospirillaceae bacterium]|jgi:hypothetical protein|nr:hypothetical protein [Oceanospirillaceae bacterium]